MSLRTAHTGQLVLVNAASGIGDGVGDGCTGAILGSRIWTTGRLGGDAHAWGELEAAVRGISGSSLECLPWWSVH